MSKRSDGKPTFKNKFLSNVLDAHDIVAIKQKKYQLQAAAFEEGFNHDGPLKVGELRRLARERVKAGDTRGGTVGYASHDRLYGVEKKDDTTTQVERLEEKEKQTKTKEVSGGIGF